MLTVAILCCAGGFLALGYAYIGVLRDRSIVDEANALVKALIDEAGAVVREPLLPSSPGNGAETRTQSPPEADAPVAHRATTFQGLANLTRALGESADRLSARPTVTIALIVAAFLFLVGGTVITLDAVINEPAERTSGASR